MLGEHIEHILKVARQQRMVLAAMVSPLGTRRMTRPSAQNSGDGIGGRSARLLAGDRCILVARFAESRNITLRAASTAVSVRPDAADHRGTISAPLGRPLEELI